MEYINDNLRKQNLPNKKKMAKIDMRKVPKEFRPTLKLLQNSLKSIDKLLMNT